MPGKEDKIRLQHCGSYFILEILNDKLDLFDTPDILSTIENHIKKNNFPNIIVDLKYIDHIDSAGIGLLIAMQNMITKNGSNIAFIGAGEKVMSIFRLTKMGSFFRIFDNLTDAVNHISGQK